MEEKVEFYTAEEVAKVLRLHPYTVRRLCREKRVPAFKFGGQWRLDKQEIEVLMRSKQTYKREP
jgi:excisionase family DNA binding protein